MSLQAARPRVTLPPHQPHAFLTATEPASMQPALHHPTGLRVWPTARRQRTPVSTGAPSTQAPPAAGRGRQREASGAQSARPGGQRTRRSSRTLRSSVSVPRSPTPAALACRSTSCAASSTLRAGGLRVSRGGRPGGHACCCPARQRCRVGHALGGRCTPCLPTSGARRQRRAGGRSEFEPAANSLPRSARHMRPAARRLRTSPQLRCPSALAQSRPASEAAVASQMAAARGPRRTCRRRCRAARRAPARPAPPRRAARPQRRRPAPRHWPPPLQLLPRSRAVFAAAQAAGPPRRPGRPGPPAPPRLLEAAAQETWQTNKRATRSTLATTASAVNKPKGEEKMGRNIPVYVRCHG